MCENHPSHPIPSHAINPRQDAYPEREKELGSGLRTRGGDEGRNVGGIKRGETWLRDGRMDMRKGFGGGGKMGWSLGG